MYDTDQWLQHFARTQPGLRFRPLYWLSVAALLPGFIGLLWALPVPRELTEISPVLNWGSVFLMAALVYYFIISLPLAIGMLPAVAAIAAFEIWLSLLDGPLRYLAVGLTLAGLAGIFACHAGRGGYRAARRDIQLLMIAPLWPLSRLYVRLGIPH